ncbi:hypothetical protein BDF20DRAFT_816288 [Mycotypha africana]|uniref:uncharacterized protein n=1 Tax=Mycotypha africana TaxID=64632 RepID=UPI002301914F|nr:uncharacterized protein BDF20DRAFT_816288 [Mycotypha africana]KAI8984299.1 hypothetical protein BDF20DRAFT_816288 [Mycotypha africana]
MCFSKAVVGTGNRCSSWYCDRQIPTEHYASFKSFVLQEHADVPENQCAAAKITYKSTGQYKVGILNRRKSRHITNIPELIARLSDMNQKQDGIDFQISLLDFDQPECDIINTAHLVKDLDIMIAPFGNGLGAGLFMKEDSVLIAISARYWNEPWFKYPMTAIGRRIFNFECQSEVCKEYDETLAKKILWDDYQIALNQTEMQEFLTTHNPEHILGPYLPTKEQAWEPFLKFYKNTARRVDVERFVPYLKEIMKNKPPKNMSYPESCKTPNVCCDLDCKIPLERNVFGEKSAWKNYL